MDNLSHTVGSLVAGELVHRCLPREAHPVQQSLRRRLLLVTCALAGNFPDLDLVLTPLLPAPIGYLLHHRGHTHTLLYALPQALLLATLLWLLWPRARGLLRASGTARSGFGLALAIGFGLHLAMDYLNSYGLHPFHPFDSAWRYGDLVFILEPFFWVGLGIPMAMMIGRRWLRILAVLLLLGPPLHFTLQGYLAWASLAALALLALLLGLAHRRDLESKSGLVLGLIAALAFVALQDHASALARDAVGSHAHRQDPDSRLLDAALTPFPANPLCWNFVSVESDEAADRYRLRRGILSLAPEWMPVPACPPGLAERAAQVPVSPAMALLSEEQGSLAALRRLKEENCHFRAWLRFARMPAVGPDSAADLRYSASTRENFTTLRFAEFSDRACPRHVPQWDFPRRDLLVPDAAKTDGRQQVTSSPVANPGRQEDAPL